MTRFAAPTALDEALAILAADPEARPVAGGTDLVVASRQGRKPLPLSLVAIDRIAELNEQSVEGDGRLVLGGLTSHAWICRSERVRERWTALADASAIVGSPATRGTGTIGGNLMNASPAAETTAPLAVLGAVVEVRSSRGSRTLPAGELATGPGRTSAAGDELLTHVAIPATPPGSGSAYIRLEYRRAMEIAVVGAAALVTLGADGRIAAARIALTAVAPTIVRAPEAEAALVGSIPESSTFQAAASAAAAAARPIDDVRASAAYRRAMLAVVVGRTIVAAVARARGESVPVPASRWAPGQEV